MCSITAPRLTKWLIQSGRFSHTNIISAAISRTNGTCSFPTGERLSVCPHQLRFPFPSKSIKYSKMRALKWESFPTQQSLKITWGLICFQNSTIARNLLLWLDSLPPPKGVRFYFYIGLTMFLIKPKGKGWISNLNETWWRTKTLTTGYNYWLNISYCHEFKTLVHL